MFETLLVFIALNCILITNGFFALAVVANRFNVA